MAITLEGNPDYIIFFDDQHVQRFVTSFSVTISANGGIGEAYIEMLYATPFLKIEYMTDVKIFIKNVFNGRYRMVFDGQIQGRQVSISPNGRRIVFTAADHTHWLQRMPVPLFFGIGDQIKRNVQLSWLARGVDVRAVDTVLAATDASLTGRNLKDVLEVIFNYIDTSLAYSANYESPDKNNIYRWVDLKSKIRVLSDFDPALRDNSIIELFYKGNVMENAYVLLHSIVSGVGYELYQDIDSIIRIKEPFWHDGILKPFTIDSSLILDFNDDTRWGSKCTRVLALGGIEEVIDRNPSGNEYVRDMMIPGVVFVQGEGDDAYFVTSDDVMGGGLDSSPEHSFIKIPVELPEGETYYRQMIQSIVMQEYVNKKEGIRYRRGGGHPGYPPPNNLFHYLDCSGFIGEVYKKVGLNVGIKTAHKYYAESQKIDANQLLPGDIGVSEFESEVPGEWGHIGMYIGRIQYGNGVAKHVWVDVTRSGQVDGVRYRETDNPGGIGWQRFGNLFGTATKGYAGYGDTNLPTGMGFHEKILPLTETERKYGINLIETSQPLIRVGRLSVDGYSREEAFDLLKDYTKYLYTSVNSSSSVASLTTVSAPWLRPGFNVWVDPGGLSRMYYINSVRHQGAGGSVQTSLGLIYGRGEEEFKELYKMNEGKPNNPFTTEQRVTSKDFYLNSGEFDYITPDNMDGFKDYKNKIHTMCGNKGSIPAHLGPYRDWYGGAFIRRNTDFLSRWDSDFTLFELYCIIAAGYGVQDVASLV